MSSVVVIGSGPELAGFALAGAEVRQAGTAEAARAAWRDLPGEVAVVVLGPAAAAALAAERVAAGAPLSVVVPS